MGLRTFDAVAAAPHAGDMGWSLSPRAIKAVVVFVVLMGLFYGFVHTPANEGAIFGPYLALLARIVGWVIGVFGYEVDVAGTLVHTPQLSIEIVRGCDAIEPAATYLAAVLASPVGWRAKMPGIVVGAAALWIINLVRIVSLFFVGVHYPDAFNMVHEGFWQVVFVVLAIVFWFVWVQWATRAERPQEFGASAPGTSPDATI